eukprot:375636_1
MVFKMEKNLEQHECKLEQKCNILDYDIKKRRYQSQLTRAKSTHSNYFDSKWSSEENCIIELLAFIHVRLFHKPAHYRNLIPNKAGISDNESLFKDKIKNNPSLKLLYKYYEYNEYDSDALYDDMFPNQDAQSNQYQFFQENDELMHIIEEYYLLKDNLSQYTIHPRDQVVMNRNLIHLDFGQDVTDWKVNKPMFENVKQEWIGNSFCEIKEEMYSEMRNKSEIIANSKHNKSTYNLLIDEVLNIKMYTDTDSLQANFRQSFRLSSGKSNDNRRAQFYHWAINLRTIFLKIEALNQAKNYHYKAGICDATLYHGLNRIFDTGGLIRQFFGTLSTTWDLQIATNFAGGTGMILQIKKLSHSKNANAISVDWISCHANEHEILLMNPQVMIQKSFVFSKDITMKSSWLKSVLDSPMDDTTFDNLSAFLQSNWIPSCLQDTLKDKIFVMDKIRIFEPQQYLNKMSLFEYIFFECCQYQIATYVVEYKYKTEKEVF